MQSRGQRHGYKGLRKRCTMPLPRRGSPCPGPGERGCRGHPGPSSRLPAPMCCTFPALLLPSFTPLKLSFPPSPPARQQRWAARWDPGGRGAGAAPRAGSAARPAAARSPFRPGTEGSRVPTSSSAAAAWGSTRPAGRPKRWPRYYPTPSAGTSGMPGEELGCCCRRSRPGRAPLPRAGLEPPAAPGQAGVRRVPGARVPPPSPLHRTWAARSQDILGGRLHGGVPGLVGAGGAAGGLCLLPTGSHLRVASPWEGLLLTLGADSLRFPLSILLKNGKKALLIKIKNKGIAKVL
ncbi:uncharacterized protein ACIBXB_019325 isoform 1-T1 [Morphnus guianensis]